MMVDVALIKYETASLLPQDIAAPVLGLDAEWAKGILDGTREDPPANIAPEVKQRLEAASKGCR